MAAAFDLQSHIGDLTKCPICLEDYTDPKSLPCLHTFCLECLRSYCQDKLPGDELLCPTCRNSCLVPEAGISAFPLNFFICDLLQAKNAAKMASDDTLRCEVCFEVCEEESVAPPPAKKYCVDCSQHVCQKCSRIHANIKTGAHLMVPLGEEMSEEIFKLRKRNCQEHKGEMVKLYCYDCKTNMCSLCVALKHKQHNVAEISEAADKVGQDMDEQVKTISDCIININDLKHQWDAEKEKFLSESPKLEAAVKQSTEEKKKLLDDHAGNLLQELETVKLNFSKEVECNKDKLDMTAVAMQSYINYSQTVREKGNSSDITHAAGELCTRATSLLQTDVLTQNVQSPDVEFVPADLVGKDVNLVGRWSCGNGKAKERSSLCEQQLPVKIPPRKLQRINTWDVIAAAQLGEELFMTEASSQKLCVYDGGRYRGNIVIPATRYKRNFVDMAACDHFHCLYLADEGNSCIVKLEIPPKHSEWQVDGLKKSAVISVTSSHHLLVFCGVSNKLKLFSTNGELYSTIELQPDIVNVASAVELVPGQYVVTHGRDFRTPHRVCVVNSEGKVLHSFGGLQGSYDQLLLDTPRGVGVDRDGFVYVDDVENDRLVLLTPKLDYLHCMRSVFRKSTEHFDRRMKLDKKSGHIYVVQSRNKGDVTYHVTIYRFET